MTVTCLYCQNIYPKKIVLNKDTLVLITDYQAKQITKTYLLLDYCNQESLIKDKILSEKDGTIINLKKESYFLQKKDSLSEVIINELELKYIQNDSILRQVIKVQKKKKNNHIITSSLSTVPAAAIGFIIGFFIKK